MNFQPSPLRGSKVLDMDESGGFNFSPKEGPRPIHLQPLDSQHQRPGTSPARPVGGSSGLGGEDSLFGPMATHGRTGLYRDPPIRRPQTTPALSTTAIHRGDPRDLSVFSKSALFRTTRESAHFADSVYHALFSLPPNLPNVDAYIENDDLKMRNLKVANWELRLPPHSAEILKTARASLRRQPSKGGQKWVGAGSRPGTASNSFLSSRPESPGLRKSLSPPGSPNDGRSTPTSRGKLEKETSFGGVSSEDIRIFIKYIDSLGNGDGEMDLTELKEAFKRIHRHRSVEAYRKYSRAQFHKLNRFVETINKSIEEWFLEIEEKGIVDGRHSGIGEKRVSVTVLRDYLPKGDRQRQRSSMYHTSRRSSWAMNSSRKISTATISENLALDSDVEEEEDLTFTESEMQALLRYVYPHNFSPKDLYLADLLDAMETADKEENSETIENRALVVLEKLEKHMAEKNLRVHDLFYLLDTDGSGSISVKELEVGLDLLCRSDPRSEALRKHKTLKQTKEEEARKKLKSKVRLARARVDKAKFTGAYESLKKIEKLKRVTGMRLYDIFGTSGFDISGDGALDAMELHGMLQSMRVDVTLDQVKALISYLDENGNETVEANEVENHLHRLKQDELLVAQYRYILNDSSVVSPGDELQKKIAAINAFHKFKRTGTEGLSSGKTMSMRDRLNRASTMMKGGLGIQGGGAGATDGLGSAGAGNLGGASTPLQQTHSLGAGASNTSQRRRRRKSHSIYKDMFHHSATLPTMKNGKLVLSSPEDPETTHPPPHAKDAANPVRKIATKQLRPIAGSPLDDRWLQSFDSRLSRDKRKMLCL